MTTPKHHPSDALLVAYGAGALGESLALAVAAHLALCPQCRAAVAAVEAMGGALIEDEAAPIAMADDALARALTALDAPPPPLSAAAVAEKPAEAALYPQPIGAYLGPAARWRRLAPGVKRMELLRRPGRGGVAHLLRISPATTLPRHGHGGLELTLVLSGSFADENGRYGPGDLAEMDGEDLHQPIADTNEDCVCLIAADAPLRFTGVIGRLMQPFIGM